MAKRFPLLITVLSALFVGAAANEVSRMERVVRSYVACKTFVGSVLVAKGDKVVLSEGYGLASAETALSNTPATKFRIGSITKQFTAASILLLEEQGKLKVEDPVKKYLPDAPAEWEKISIFNLLTHTAGIPDLTSFPDHESAKTLPTTPARLVALFIHKPLIFEPGTRFSYSNSSYILLGYLIERITGDTYQRFVQQNIFNVLSMKDSGYDSDTAILANRATEYSFSAGRLLKAHFIDMSYPFAAGGLYSTTEDLLKWEEGLFGGKLISAASLGKMTTPFRFGYGFGLIIRTVNGCRVIDHLGSIDGFDAELAYYPDSKVTIIALANINGRAVDQIATNLGNIAACSPGRLGSIG